MTLTTISIPQTLQRILHRLRFGYVATHTGVLIQLMDWFSIKAIDFYRRKSRLMNVEPAQRQKAPQSD
jgi:hypothetical protein